MKYNGIGWKEFKKQMDCFEQLITSPKTEMIPITKAPIIFANKVPQKEDTLKLQ